jgi:hypothetical protein
VLTKRSSEFRRGKNKRDSILTLSYPLEAEYDLSNFNILYLKLLLR